MYTPVDSTDCLDFSRRAALCPVGDRFSARHFRMVLPLRTSHSAHHQRRPQQPPCRKQRETREERGTRGAVSLCVGNISVCGRCLCVWTAPRTNAEGQLEAIGSVRRRSQRQLCRSVETRNSRAWWLVPFTHVAFPCGSAARNPVPRPVWLCVPCRLAA